MKRAFSVFYTLLFALLYACNGGGGGSQNNTDITTNTAITYNLHIKDSEGLLLTSFETDMGHALKILDTSTRLVVLDYENSRILFYNKGATLTASSIIGIVGTHSNVNDGSAFHPTNNNKLNSQFSGTVHNNELWVTNYTFGEILRFDLDGNFISSQPGKFAHIDSDKTTLYAFEGVAMYTYSVQQSTFEYKADLPISVNVSIDDYLYRRGAIHLGYGRLAVNDVISNQNTMRVFDLPALLTGQTTEILTVPDAKSFAILSDKIIWTTVYTTNLEYCDLNGANCGAGTFKHYLYSFRHNPGSDNMHIIGAYGIQAQSTQLIEVESINRNLYYWAGKFLGGDDINLYFYDHSNGGFAITPLNHQNNTVFSDPNNEIGYSGWHLNARAYNGMVFLQSEWPQGSYEMYMFDIANMNSTNFAVMAKQGFDLDVDFVYVLNGVTIDAYTHQGVFDHQIILSNLTNSNLQSFTDTSYGLFAKNDNNFFIAHNYKLNIFSVTGEFIAMHDLTFSNTYSAKTMLFADNNRILLNQPLSVYDLSTHQVSSFSHPSANGGGFVNGNNYWYESGHNQYTKVGF
ncbi:MAG: hypothetical protein OEZ16_05070 [Chromatiales bacterium]|nr:hypothetical protein [Chromatiales bacterium]